MKSLETPEVIHQVLLAGAHVIPCISGGKDSQAMLKTLDMAYNAEWRSTQWSGTWIVGHADVGVMDWPFTPQLLDLHAGAAGLPLQVVRRTGGDLLDLIKSRMDKLAGSAPHWPSPAARYCTSDTKRGPLDRLARSLEKGGVVISVIGERGEESPARAKKPIVEIRKGITAERLKGLALQDALYERKPNERVGINWYPIQTWKVGDVWSALGTSQDELDQRRDWYDQGQQDKALDGWPASPVYVYGADRHSCAMCIMAGKKSLRIGAVHVPQVYDELVGMEVSSGYSFQNGRWLRDIFSECETNDQNLQLQMW